MIPIAYVLAGLIILTCFVNEFLKRFTQPNKKSSQQQENAGQKTVVIVHLHVSDKQ